jgi:transcriptional regulator with XRE-family HTH domain
MPAPFNKSGNPKVIQPADKLIGLRIRARRLELDMSQEKLADAIGVTFQQVQKYEKGTNRVSGSRILQVAKVLKMDVADLFEAADGKEASLVTEFMATPGAADLARAFIGVPGPVRTSVLGLLRHFTAISHATR